MQKMEYEKKIKSYVKKTKKLSKFYTERLFGRKKPILSYWWRGVKNVGDLMGPFILNRATNRKVFHIHDLPKFVVEKYEKVISVGSILQEVEFSNPVIWGTGVIDSELVPNMGNPEFLSVRGPLTRKAVIDSGYSCPSLYGDPALLLDRFVGGGTDRSVGDYSGETKMGLVLHYEDENKLNVKEDEEVSLISVRQSVTNFCKKIRSKDVILSSSLHGIITAHAFGTPAVWMKKCSNKPGGSFKYKDYLLSIGRDEKCVELEGKKSIREAKRRIDDVVIRPPNNKFVDKIYDAMKNIK